MTFWIAGVFPFISFMQNISPTMNGQVKEGIIANSLAFKKKLFYGPCLLAMLQPLF